MTVIEKMRSRGITPRAALYARFSSASQREESIEAQLRAMHEYCRTNRISVVNEYCDRAKTATMDDSPESIILESVLEGMSEYYSKNLAREVMKGMKESARECRHMGGTAPFGFDVDKATQRLVVNDREAEAVLNVFRVIAAGESYGQAMNKLNNAGFKTRSGNDFKRSSIYEMLRNEKYNGTYVFNRTAPKNEAGKRNNHKSKPEDEIIRVPNGVPKIVDDETFFKVQEILQKRKRKKE